MVWLTSNFLSKVILHCQKMCLPLSFFCTISVSCIFLSYPWDCIQNSHNIIVFVSISFLPKNHLFIVWFSLLTFLLYWLYRFHDGILPRLLLYFPLVSLFIYMFNILLHVDKLGIIYRFKLYYYYNTDCESTLYLLFVGFSMRCTASIDSCYSSPVY